MLMMAPPNVPDAAAGQLLAPARVNIGKLEGVVRDHPQNAVAQYQLGIAYREVGDDRSAAAHLEAAVHCGFDNLGAQVNLIEAAFASGQSALALETAKRAVSPAVTSPNLLLRIGRLLFDHLFYKEALQAFQLAQRLTPDAFEPRFRLALTYYVLDNFANTLATLQAAPAFSPQTPEAASLKASAEAKLGHFETASSMLRSIIERAPQNPHAYINLALIELDRGHSPAAEAVLEQFRSLPPHASAKVFYRVSHNSCPEIATALEQGVSPALLSPAKGEFYYHLAAQLQSGLNYLSAAEMIRLAQIKEGNAARVLLIAGTSCVNQDPLAPEAAALLRGAVAKDGSLYEAFYLLGQTYSRQGKLADAVSAYRRAAELHPSAAYYVNLGKALPNRQAAIAEFQHALNLDSTYAMAHLELGRAYLEVEDFVKARQELGKAAELDQDLYEADYLLGRLLHRMGQEEQSRQLLKRFTEKKTALMEASVISAGYVGSGH